MIPNKIIYAVLCVHLMASPAQGEIFKWTDENGKTHFTDDVGKIPDVEIDRLDVLDLGKEVTPGENKEGSPGRGGSDTLKYGDKRQKDCLKRCASKRFIGQLCKQKCGVE